MLRMLLDLLIQRQLLASRLFNDRGFHRAFAKDLLRAKKRIIIESPYLTERRVRLNMGSLRAKHNYLTILNSKSTTNKGLVKRHMTKEKLPLSTKGGY